METGLGSPRSSSGYGSSEEDPQQGCSASSRRRRGNLAQHGGAIAVPASSADGVSRGGSTGSAPQTPQSLSPSETGSSLSSPDPFSIDFRSVFDLGAMPDFADLAAFAAADAFDDVELPADIWPGELENWANELDRVGCDAQSPTKTTAQVDDTTSKRAEKRTLRDDTQILVSLLKRPKAELDWITTGQTPAPAAVDQLFGRANCLDQESGVRVTIDAEQVASASPLQRLKALTNSDVVNHTVNQPAPPLSISRPPTIITTAVTLSPAVPVRVVRQTVSSLPHDGRTLVIRRQSASPTLSATPSSPSGTAKRRPSAQKLVSLPRPGSVDRRRPSPAAAVAASTAARTEAAPVAARRVRTELDDHRYSTPMPPTRAERPWHGRSSTAAKPSRPGRSSVDSRCPLRRTSVTVSSKSSTSSSSVLEMLLRTSKPMRPNAGSDAVLAVCRSGAVAARRPSTARRRVQSETSNCVDVSRTQPSQPPATFTTFQTTMLTDLAGATVPKGDVVDQPVAESAAASAAPTSSLSSSCSEPLSAASESFSLFSEHLLCDSQGVIDVGLLSDDQPVWTPSRLDDKVISSELEEIMQGQVRQDDTWLQQYLSELL